MVYLYLSNKKKTKFGVYEQLLTNQQDRILYNKAGKLFKNNCNGKERENFFAEPFLEKIFKIWLIHSFQKFSLDLRLKNNGMKHLTLILNDLKHIHKFSFPQRILFFI